MTRFLHTADWQLGLKLRRIGGDRGARLRLERFETVRRIAALAREREVEAVVVAGDVFDDNAVGAPTLQAARDALAAFRPIPVLLLPGNHDAATPDSALARLAPASHGLEHVRPLLEAEPVMIGDATFFPCPLRRRHSPEDPTRALPRRGEGEGVRVALAHGGVLDFGESTETPNRIDAPAVLERGFDYLALGDWHGLFSLGPRVWYPGTPEPTRFEEKDPGYVLVVEIDGPGATPRVEPVAVARSRWLRRRETLGDDASVDALERWLRALDERSWTLLRLEVDGSLSLAARSRLDAVLDAAAGELLHLRLIDRGLAVRPSDEDLAALRVEGFVGRAAEALRSLAARGPAVIEGSSIGLEPVGTSEAVDTSDATEATDALRLLYRFLAEEEG